MNALTQSLKAPYSLLWSQSEGCAMDAEQCQG